MPEQISQDARDLARRVTFKVIQDTLIALADRVDELHAAASDHTDCRICRSLLDAPYEGDDQ